MKYLTGPERRAARASAKLAEKEMTFYKWKRSRRHWQLLHKRWTGYSKLFWLEAIVQVRYIAHEAWLDARELPDFTSYLPDDTGDLIYEGY